MTDPAHLPECSYSPGQPGFGGLNSGVPSTQPYIPGSPCICDRLRACEARVTERWEALRGWGESFAYKTGSDNGFDAGYRAALDAAREAVAARHPRCVQPCEMCAEWDDALAAIDALRGER